MARSAPDLEGLAILCTLWMPLALIYVDVFVLDASLNDRWFSAFKWLTIGVLIWCLKAEKTALPLTVAAALYGAIDVYLILFYTEYFLALESWTLVLIGGELVVLVAAAAAWLKPSAP